MPRPSPISFAFIVAAVVFSEITLCESNINTGSYKVWQGYRNADGILGEYDVVSSLQCALECSQHQSCNSYNLGPVELYGDDGSRVSGGNRRSCELVKTDNDSMTTFTEEAGWTFATGIFIDCSDLSQRGVTNSGVYALFSDAHSDFPDIKDVYCDMETAGAGWTVIVRRMDGSANFDQNWNAYKTGFGNASSEYWLGNEYLHHLTGSRACKLRFKLENWNGETRYAEYSSFRVTSEADNYRLLLGDYSGTASADQANDEAEGFLYHNNMQFTTNDRDNDNQSNNCAPTNLYGGFWYNACARVSPTTLHYCQSSSCGSHRYNIRWLAWSPSESLRHLTMMMRPASN